MQSNKDYRYSIKPIRYFVIGILAFCASCYASSIKGDGYSLETKKYEKFAFSKFGNDTISIYNRDKTYVLCLKSDNLKAINPNAPTIFFIYDLKENKIIYKDQISSAVISWYSNNELLISTQKGIITSPIDKGKSKYIYNLKTRKKTIYSTISID